MARSRFLLSISVPLLVGGCVAASEPNIEAEPDTENTATVTGAAGTCPADLATAAKRQHQAENLFFYMSGRPDLAPTDTALKAKADAIMAEMPSWLNYPGVNGYMAAPMKYNTITSICGVKATLYRWNCVTAQSWYADTANRCTTGSCPAVACTYLKNRAGTMTGLQMLDALSVEAERVYPNSRPFMHIDNGTYIEFDPATARATASLSSTLGSSASGVYTSDNTATTIRTWTTTSQKCSLGTSCPKHGQPCSPTSMVSGNETSRAITLFLSGGVTYTKCW